MTSYEQIVAPIRDEFALFQREFEVSLQTDNSLLHEVLSVLSSRRGKQLRPLLVLLSAKLAGEVNNKTIRTAVALELLHTASLIHDDVVDDSDFRRGQPAIQRQFSNRVAILVGDFLLSKVIEIISSLRNVQILGIVSDMGKALSGGELMQMGYVNSATTPSQLITEKQYFDIITRKTARLFAACAEAGAVSAGATMRQFTALSTYGEQLGICFQMQDDLLDFSDSEELGKPTMQDARERKITLPLLVSLQRAPQDESRHILSLCRENMQEQDEQDIRSFVLRYDGIRYARRRMEEHRQKAAEALQNVIRPQHSTLQDSLIRSLFTLLDYSVNRQM